MEWHDLLLILIAFVSEVLGTVSGFGSSTFFMPVGTLFETFHFVLVLTAMLHVFANISKVTLFRKFFSWKHILTLVFPTLLLTIFGALLTDKVPISMSKTILGVFLCLFSLIQLFLRKNKIRTPNFIATGLVYLSGFLTGFIGTGGALRGLGLASFGLTKGAFVVLSAWIDFGGDLFRGGIYVKNGYLETRHLYFIPFLGLAAYAGAVVGKKLLKKIPEKMFFVIVEVSIFLSGLTLIFSTALQ